MSIDEITEIVDVEIARNRTILNFLNSPKDEEILFIRGAMDRAEANVREGVNEPEIEAG